MIAAPPSTNNIVVNSGGNFEQMSITAYMMNGVNQTTPIQNSYILNGNGIAVSQTLTTSISSTCIDFVSVSGSPAITLGLNQVLVISNTNAASNQLI